jgi:hypothetical protein
VLSRQSHRAKFQNGSLSVEALHNDCFSLKRHLLRLSPRPRPHLSIFQEFQRRSDFSCLCHDFIELSFKIMRPHDIFVLVRGIGNCTCVLLLSSCKIPLNRQLFFIQFGMNYIPHFKLPSGSSILHPFALTHKLDGCQLRMDQIE